MTDKIETADVCLILEGSYPYVRGGVSAWVHSLIEGLPELKFSLLVVIAPEGGAKGRAYTLPPNVVSFAEVCVHKFIDETKKSRKRRKEQADAWNRVREYHQCTGADRLAKASDMFDIFSDPKTAVLSTHDAFYSDEAWELLRDLYRERADGTSFVDYFWTWRAVHAPLFQTMMAEIPPARVYHAVSTGYAGLLGVLAKQRMKRPLLLTEHGVYVRERVIDIAQADWIYEEPVRIRTPQSKASPLKEMWSKFFTDLGDICYASSDLILTLFEGNRKLQEELGAQPEKLRIIPNGVDIDKFASLRSRRQAKGTRPLRVGYVGRVVPIKDIKTLIRACAIVHRTMPGVEFWLVGPKVEDPDYAAECEQLAGALGVGNLTFLGMKNVLEIYPEIDVLVLTSISEGQPLTILEAACAGVPTVATDVGACRELCEGTLGRDSDLGASGLITGVGDPEATARAICTILGDDAVRKQFSENGIQRVESYYREQQVLQNYRTLYDEYAARGEYGGNRF